MFWGGKEMAQKFLNGMQGSLIHEAIRQYKSLFFCFYPFTILSMHTLGDCAVGFKLVGLMSPYDLGPSIWVKNWDKMAMSLRHGIYGPLLGIHKIGRMCYEYYLICDWVSSTLKSSPALGLDYACASAILHSLCGALVQFGPPTIWAPALF